MEKFKLLERNPTGLHEPLSKELGIFREVNEHTVEGIGRREKMPVASQR